MLNEEISLADLAIACCVDPKKMIAGWDNTINRSNRKKRQLDLRRFQAKLRSANRFELEPSFVALAVGASLGPPSVLTKFVSMARSPYKKTWIEWDQIHRIETGKSYNIYENEIGDETATRISKRSGVLIEQLDETIFRFSGLGAAVEPGDVKLNFKGGVVFWPLSYILDTEWDSTCRIKDHLTEDDIWMDKFCKLLDNHYGRSWAENHKNPLPYLLNGGVAYGPKWATDYGGMKEPEEVNWLANSMRYGICPIMGSTMGFLLDKIIKEKGNNEAALALGRAIIETIGDLRWFVTILALINAYPPQTILVEPTGHYSVKGVKKKFMEYHRLSIKVPKVDPVKKIIRSFSGPAFKKRAHMVRGHWRLLRNKEIIWISAHQRGDASLGWVQKDYVIERNPRV